MILKVWSKIPNLYFTNLLHTKKKESPASSHVSFWQDRGAVETDFSSSYPVFPASKGNGGIYSGRPWPGKGLTRVFVHLQSAKARQSVADEVFVCQAVNAARWGGTHGWRAYFSSYS